MTFSHLPKHFNPPSLFPSPRNMKSINGCEFLAFSTRYPRNLPLPRQLIGSNSSTARPPLLRMDRYGPTAVPAAHEWRGEHGRSLFLLWAQPLLPPSTQRLLPSLTPAISPQGATRGACSALFRSSSPAKDCRNQKFQQQAFLSISCSSQFLLSCDSWQISEIPATIILVGILSTSCRYLVSGTLRPPFFCAC